MADMTVNTDAWSDGQVKSKMWLCRTLEEIVPRWKKQPVIWILGGWYGNLAFMLFSRDRLRPERIVSFDLDPKCEDVARAVNNSWDCDGKFQAVTADCNTLRYEGSAQTGPRPNIIINTSCEHFVGVDWFTTIPTGSFIVMQSTDMDHIEHIAKVTSRAEMEAKYHLTETYFSGELAFSYPGKSFKRYMLVGVK